MVLILSSPDYPCQMPLWLYSNISPSQLHFFFLNNPLNGISGVHICMGVESCIEA